MSELPKRKNPRLSGYDYSDNGAYFITICTKDRLNLFGEIFFDAQDVFPDGQNVSLDTQDVFRNAQNIVGCDALGAPKMRLSKYGLIVDKEIKETALYYQSITIDKYVVMPNHIHMIIVIDGNGVPRASRPTMLIPNIIAALKKKTNKQCDGSLWQKSYYDHIIRNETDYLRIWQYIDENPVKWADDKYYIG